MKPPIVALRIAASIQHQASDFPGEVVWHGGEPLTTPLAHMRALLAPFEPLRRAGRLVHAVQSNATLITPGWIDLFNDYDIQVGVSIDGPAHLNAIRADRRGRDRPAATRRHQVLRDLRGHHGRHRGRRRVAAVLRRARLHRRRVQHRRTRRTQRPPPAGHPRAGPPFLAAAVATEPALPAPTRS